MANTGGDSGTPVGLRLLVIALVVAALVLWIHAHSAHPRHAPAGPHNLGSIVACPQSIEGCAVGTRVGGGTLLIPLPIIGPPPCAIDPVSTGRC
jgi:hypothetical protein